jgi:adenylate cyclase
MDSVIDIMIYEEGRVAYQGRLVAAVEFGRQNIDDAPPYAEHEQSGTVRVIIARLDEVTIPRRLLRVERLDHDRVRLSNPSRIPVRLDSGATLDPNGVREMELPVTVTVGSKSLTLRSTMMAAAPVAPVPAPARLESLVDSNFGPAADAAASLMAATVARDRLAEGNLDHEALMHWIQAVIGVIQSAAGTTDFFRRAARALVDLIGLDLGCVLLRENNRWVVHSEGRAGRFGTSGLGKTDIAEWQPSRLVLDSVLQQKKTFWQKQDAAAPSESLLRIHSVVASPIRSARGEVIGVLYGERRRAGSATGAITRLVAMLVEMLAGGVAAGLARMEQEQAALRARVLMEQFFTPDLSRRLAENPDLLKGRDAEVTMLSCDIRGFSRICSNLGPTRTLDWVQNVLGSLSDCVLAEQGVLVDYVGDELLAMWGAPGDQPDHARRACRAALAMLGSVPLLNERWLETVREPMGLSIGISSGTARVGNIGSERKFKYGALGTTVNLASRVQGATKYLKVPALITGSVKERLDAPFPTRRICQLEVVNIPDPVMVYQLTETHHEGWSTLKDGYEEALSHFETQDFRRTARILGELLAQRAFRDDGPSLVLMQRAVTCLVEDGKTFNAVWKLADKGK